MTMLLEDRRRPTADRRQASSDTLGSSHSRGLPDSVRGARAPGRWASVARGVTRVGGLRSAVCGLLALGASVSSAQTASNGVTVPPLPVGARNFVSALYAEPVAGAPDLLLAGPRLVISEDGRTFRFPGSTALDPASAPDARAYALDAEGDTIWVALGFADANVTDSQGNATPSAAGFAVSTDRGQTFAYRFPQLDAATATSVIYGVTQMLALPITELANSPPYGLSLDPRSGDVWVAGGRSGLRVSSDGGRTFRRQVLPPDTLTALDPREVNPFIYVPQGERVQVTIDGETFELVSQYAANFFAYAVLVDEAGTVWAGTAAGLNRSDTTDVYTFQLESGTRYRDRAWRRFVSNGTPDAPAGDVVFVLREQLVGDPTLPVGSPGNPRNPVWFVYAPACADREPSVDCLEESGLSVWTGDDAQGQPQFEPRLLGVRVNDVAFNGDAVFAAATDGLYTAMDGLNFSAVRTFRDAAGTVLPIDPSAGVLAVTVTEAGEAGAVLWVGTADGLLRRSLADGGAMDTGWTLYRAAIPNNPATPTVDVPAAEVFAYPNPYVVGNGYLRFRFESGSDGPVQVRIFSFGMEPVRTLDVAGRAGSNDVLWDGRADDGGRVATGVYVYTVEAGGETFSGRLIVVN